MNGRKYEFTKYLGYLGDMPIPVECWVRYDRQEPAIKELLDFIREHLR